MANTLFIGKGMNLCLIAIRELQASLLYHCYLGWYEQYKYEQVNKSELERHIQIIRSELLSL